MTYAEALSYIASLEPRGWRLGLDRMNEFVRRADLLDAIGGPQGPKFIHVAGTNGKGSTTAFLQSLLVESDYRTGAFFSPYVVDPRERVQFGRELIPREDVARLTEKLMPIGESLTDTEFGGVTEFEFKTALGFAFWKEKECEWVALEVGLGGRLDSTNVITPAVSVITSISLDHTSVLGSTLEEIASEKAGIIKPGVPLVLGPVPDEAAMVICKRADELGSPTWMFGSEILWENGAVKTPRRQHTGLHPGIRGAMQEVNLSLAVAALDAAGATRDEEAIRLGARRASVPGRFQELNWRGRTLLFDGAHNSEAAKVLRDSLDAYYPGRKVHLVTNMIQGHDIVPFYGDLLPLSLSVHVVPINFHRARPASETISELAPLGLPVTAHSSVLRGLEAAIRESSQEDLIVVTGSYYLVGEAIQVVS